MSRQKWTPKEAAEIWKRGIKCFPDPKNGARYGISDNFLPVAINNWDIRERFQTPESFSITQSEFVHAKPHGHRFTGDLLFGGTGGGKTTVAVGLGMEYAFMFPGSRGLVGGRVYGDLRENVIDQYKQLLTIKSPWDHPAVKSHPSTTSSHNKKLIIEPYPGANWSEIEFFQLDDWERVRGRNRDWFHAEEISQFLESEIIDEAPRRLRSMTLPVSHLICTTNPPPSTSHWTYPKWNINQYLETYLGAKTGIGTPCKCHLCQPCLDEELGEFPYGEDHYCTNPRCAHIKVTGKRSKRDFYNVRDSSGVLHETFCPGNEYYWRIMFSNAASNPHKRADYLQTIVGSSDSRVADLHAKGKPIELNANNVYASFSYLNILDKNETLDITKDIHWGFDFNTRPQCSALCQEHYLDNGELDFVHQFDEVILFDIREVLEDTTGKDRDRGAGPEHVAAAFIDRYGWLLEHKYTGTIHLWGDPTAVNKTTSPLEKTKYQIIHDSLVEAGFKVKMEVRKVKGQVRHIPIIDRTNNANWIFKDSKGNIRFKVNPKCEYTITSIRDLKLAEDGVNPDKKNIDEYARRTTRVIYPEDIYKKVLFVSHPSDALTYYLYQKFPLIKFVDQTFLAIPGEGGAKLDGDKVVPIKPEPAAKDRISNLSDLFSEANRQETLFETLSGGLSPDEYQDSILDINNFGSYFS